MAIEPPDYQPAPWWRSPRAAAVLAVVALHAALVVFFLASQSGPAALAPGPREMFTFFPPPPPRLPQRIEAPPRARLAPPFVRTAPSMAIAQPPPATTPLELSLFRCAPENLAKLTPSERAQCGEAFSASAFVAPLVGAAPPRDAERWQVALDQRNTPESVPCTNIERTQINPITHETSSVVVTDALCVLRNLGDGSAP